jgi:hypothetical protein
MINWDIEEPLDLRSVQVHCEDAVDSGGGEKVGHQFRGDWNAWLIFPVLPCISKKRHHGCDPLCAGASRRVNQDEQLHDVVVGWRARWLDNKDVLTSDVFVDFHCGFPVWECFDLNIREWLAKGFCDFFRESAVCGSTDDFHRRGIVDMLGVLGNTLPT